MLRYGRSARRINFVILKDNKKIALGINDETYHAERIIPDENPVKILFM